MTLPPRRSPDRFDDETLDLAMLQATDTLLDRLGRREPTPDDLDDPVIASLALLAAEVDVDEVPVTRTRRVLQVRGQWPPVVLDTEDGGLSVVAHGTPASVLGAIAPPRALPRTPSPDVEEAGTDERRPRIRLLPAVAAAAAAIVLSMTAAAAVTGGASVNPQRVVQYVIDHWHGGASPTPDPRPSTGSAPRPTRTARAAGTPAARASLGAAASVPTRPTTGADPSAVGGSGVPGGAAASGDGAGTGSAAVDQAGSTGTTGGGTQPAGAGPTPHSPAPFVLPTGGARPGNGVGNGAGNGAGNGIGNGKPKVAPAAP